MELTYEQKLAYIAAFIDGEGHVGFHTATKGNLIRSISFCNTDKSLVDIMTQYLHDCGFETYFGFTKATKPKYHDRWTVYVAGGTEAIRRFASLIPLQSIRKQETMRMIVESYDARVQLLADRKKPNCKCKVCGVEFYRLQVFIDRGGGELCSTECAGKSRSKSLIEIECKGCKSIFKAKAHHKRTYCSASCYEDASKERMANQASSAASERWNPKVYPIVVKRVCQVNQQPNID